MWVRAQRAADRLNTAHPQRVLTVRFEDFVGQQERTLCTICRFIGIDFMPAMLDVSASTEAARLVRMSTLWVSNAFRPIPANKTKFRQSLSLEGYGYECLATRSVQVTSEMQGQAALPSDDRRALGVKCAHRTSRIGACE